MRKNISKKGKRNKGLLNFKENFLPKVEYSMFE